IFLTKYVFDNNSPCGLAVDSHNNILATDTSLNEVLKLAPRGAVIFKWSNSSSLAGEFSIPKGVAVDSHDNVIVADSGNRRIQKFSADGSLSVVYSTFGPSDEEFSFPSGVAVDANDAIYVVDQGAQQIVKLSQGGSWIATIGGVGQEDGALQTPTNAAVDGDGSLYVVNASGNIVKYSAAGVYLTKWFYGREGDEGSPTGSNVAIDPNGDVHVIVWTQNGFFIRKYTADGLFISQSTGEFLNNPAGIDIDEEGAIYLCNTDDHKIQKYSSRL
ncbi:MAG: hypothetical protein GY869_06960, partial [Planctomycetes bacterium]|nr:hypothetical protein [Planctomycetota bacterium]